MNIKLQYFLTSVPKTKKNKQKIFGTLKKAEAAGSRKSNKKFFVEMFEELPSEHILAAIDPGVYMAGRQSKDKNAQLNSSLLDLHVKQAVDFACVAERWCEGIDEREKAQR